MIYSFYLQHAHPWNGLSLDRDRVCALIFQACHKCGAYR